MPRGPPREEPARATAAEADRCDQRCVHCQSLSVHVGPVTLRFAPEAAESLWNTLGEALFKLHGEAKSEPRLRLATMRGQGTA